MIKQLSVVTSEVMRVTRKVGTDGRLGGQARNIAEVAELKGNLNTMIDNLRLTIERNTEQDWLKTNLARGAFAFMSKPTTTEGIGRPLSQIADYAKRPRRSSPLAAIPPQAAGSPAMSLRHFLAAPDARGPGLSGHLIGLAAAIAAALALVLPAAWSWPKLGTGQVSGAFLLLGLGTIGTLAGAAALLVVARRQGRRLRSLAGPGLSAGSIARGFILFGLIGALFFAVVFMIDDAPPVWRPDTPRFAYAAFGLVAMLAIAAAEEIVFRAYLPQGLATRLPPGITVAVTALAFGLLHGLGEGWPGVAYRIVLALALFRAIAVTGNIGAAIGAHAANNVMAVIMMPVDQPGHSLALLELPGTGEGLDGWSVVTLGLRCVLFIVALQLWQRHCHKKLEITERRG